MIFRHFQIHLPMNRICPQCAFCLSFKATMKQRPWDETAKTAKPNCPDKHMAWHNKYAAMIIVKA